MSSTATNGDMRGTAADYINEYSARHSPFAMCPPWRHPNALVVGLYWKREVWVQQQILDGLGRDQSHSRDISLDAFADAFTQYRDAIQTAWDRRVKPRSAAVASYQNRILEQAI